MTDSIVALALGAFRFAILRATYNELRHRTEERWTAVDRIGADPALHFAGHGAETLTVNGVIFPHVHGTMRFVQAMRAEARKGEPMLLIDGLGFYWGQWVIGSVDETSNFHLADGAPRRQRYSLTLTRYVAPGDER